MSNLTLCHSHYFIAAKRHHEHSDSYKEKHLVGGFLTVSETWTIIITAGSIAAGIADSAEKVAKSYILINRQRGSLRLV